MPSFAVGELRHDLTSTPLVVAVVDGTDIRHLAAEAARAEAAGADLIAVAGLSAAPGAAAVADAVAAVVGVTGLAVIVETAHAGIAEPALAAGAAMVHDRSGAVDDAVVAAVAAHGAALAVSHAGPAPTAEAVVAVLAGQLRRAEAGGVAADRTAVDPGLDLGKPVAQTVALLQQSAAVTHLGRPVTASLVGAPPGDDVAMAAVAIAGGWRLVRTRDPGRMRRACAVLAAVLAAP